MKDQQKGSAIIIWISTITILAIGIGASIYFNSLSYPSPINFIPPPCCATASSTYDSTSTMVFIDMKIALLAVPHEGNNPETVRGCDIVVMSHQAREVPLNQGPLTSAMKELFAKKEPWPYSEGFLGSFISSQKNLFFDHAIVENGVANIYLTGNYTLGGECDDPRTETQIVETAKQFSTVKSVQIFLNGKEFKTPNERG